MRACKYGCMYVCVYVCMYVCMLLLSICTDSLAGNNAVESACKQTKNYIVAPSLWLLTAKSAAHFNNAYSRIKPPVWPESYWASKMCSLHRSGWQYDKLRFISVTFAAAAAAAAAVSLQYNNVLTYVECVLHCQLLGHNSASSFTLSKYEVSYKVLP